jgi:hypothetical protein
MNLTDTVSFVEMSFVVVKFVSSYQESAFPRSYCPQIRNKPCGYHSVEMTNQNESELQILPVWHDVLFPMLWYLSL